MTRPMFTDLGGGPWVNVSMFGIFVLGYGIAAMTIADYMERKTANRASGVIETEKVPA